MHHRFFQYLLMILSGSNEFQLGVIPHYPTNYLIENMTFVTSRFNLIKSTNSVEWWKQRNYNYTGHWLFHKKG